MEIEIVVRMDADTEDFNLAQNAIRNFFNERKYIDNMSIYFNNFHFMAAQPIEDLHDYEEVRKVGRPKKNVQNN